MSTTVEIGAFVTIPDQPIATVGMDFPVSTGTITVTEEDLLDVVASQQDPAVKQPRLKIGHGVKGTLNAVEESGGLPAFGRVSNLRYEPSDMTLYGDYVDVPAWLGEIFPKAYPNRSMEAVQGATTVTGKKWRLLISAVSLLGISWPGISTLADVQAAFSPQGPEGVSVIEAQAAVDDVRREFMDSVAIGDQYWWWIRSMLIDPNELIVDNDDGELYRMAFTIADDGEVSFGDPQPVKIVYEDVPAKAAARIAAQGMIAARGTAVAAQFSTRAESRIQATKEGVQEMDPKVLEKLGLAADASPEDVIAKIDQMREEGTSAPKPVAEGDPTPEPEVDTTKAGPEDISPEQIAAGAKKHGLRLVDDSTFDQIKKGAEAGLAAAERERIAARDGVIVAAVKDGKIPPARREHFSKLYDADPEGTTTLLAEMAAGAIPIAARGGSVTDEFDAEDQASSYPMEWLAPHEREMIAANNGSERAGRIITERGEN